MKNLSFTADELPANQNTQDLLDALTQQERDEILMDSSQSAILNLNGDESLNGLSIRRRLAPGEEAFILQSQFAEDTRDQYSEILS